MAGLGSVSESTPVELKRKEEKKRKNDEKIFKKYRKNVKKV